MSNRSRLGAERERAGHRKVRKGGAGSRRGTFYFSRKYSIKDAPKCEQLICTMGMEGYGIFMVLLEVLRVQPGHTYPLKNLPIVAHKYYTTLEQVQRVVHDFGLFTIEKDEFYFPGI